MAEQIGQQGAILGVQAGQQLLEARSFLASFKADNPAGLIGPDCGIGGNVQVPGPDPGALQRIGEMGLALLQLLFDLARLAVFIRARELTLHRGDKPRQVPFGEVVVRPGLHRLHGDLFADDAGNENERHIARPPGCQREGGGAAEVRHRIVRDDQIPRVLVERRRHRVGGVDSLVRDLPLATPQRLHEQHGVVV
jgi:hypothetical protein